MSYSFGWWDFNETDQPAVVNRYSAERIVRRGTLEPGMAPPDEPWLRFDYIADDLTYPLAVRWAPEAGEILLDHNKSAEIWRRETGSGAAPPPFGTFVRVDDLVPDALWCWPGVIDAHFRRLKEDPPPAPPRRPDPFHKGRSPLTLFRLGGYQNGHWQDRLVCEEANDVHFSPLSDGSLSSIWGYQYFYKDVSVSAMISAGDFRQSYEHLPQYTQRVFLAPDASAPSPLVFVDPVSCPDFGVDYPEWMRRLLAGDPVGKPTVASPGQVLEVHEPLTPHAVSLDSKRLIRHPWVIVTGGHHLPAVAWWALTLDFMGLPVVRPGRADASPGRELRYGRQKGGYMGGPYSESNALDLWPGWPGSIQDLPASGVVRLADYDAWLSEHTPNSVRWTAPRGVDVSLQQRDFIDALFLFTHVDDRVGEATGRLNRRQKDQKFDCIASSARFLGGRLVNSRVKYNYIAAT